MRTPDDKVAPGECLTRCLVESGVGASPGIDSLWAHAAAVPVMVVRRAARGRPVKRWQHLRLLEVMKAPSLPLPENCGGLPVRKWGGHR